MNDTSQCIFGSYNVTTKKSMDGYIDKNGTMKYKKIPWYKKLYRKMFPSEETKAMAVLMKQADEANYVYGEYICVATLYSRFIWSDTKRPFDVAVYRDYIKSTGKTTKLYCDTHRGRKYFNCDAYDKDGLFI